MAIAGRGTLMGNRGCLHDDERRIRRDFVGKRWILCVLEFKDRKRTVMTPRRYTELFFLDEPTGLAAGHRPCAECRHARYLEFLTAWARAGSSDSVGVPSSGSFPSAAQLDGVLHGERLDAGRGHRVHGADFSDLPSGTMVLGENEEQALLVWGDALFPWSMTGYGPPMPRPVRAIARVLTPPSVVGALKAGYDVEAHSSARL